MIIIERAVLTVAEVVVIPIAGEVGLIVDIDFILLIYIPNFIQINFVTFHFTIFIFWYGFYFTAFVTAL